jgi:hypothetical protein
MYALVVAQNDAHSKTDELAFPIDVSFVCFCLELAAHDWTSSTMD